MAIRAAEKPKVISHCYTGRENDGTGVYFYRGRYYNPTFQRFISEDPIGIAGGIDLYAYVGDNPITFVDPFGFDKRGSGFGGSGGGTSTNNPEPPNPNNPNSPPQPDPNQPPACQDPGAAQQQAYSDSRSCRSTAHERHPWDPWRTYNDSHKTNRAYNILLGWD